MNWRFHLGGVVVQRIGEMLSPGFDPAFLFPAFDPAVFDEDPQLRGPNFWDAATGKLMSSMQSWVFRIGSEIVLIDTGCGNDKIRTEPAFARFHRLSLPYLQTLADAGVRPEDVTTVINTHLHVDHIGWNTRWVDGRWVPTFPRARYVIGAVEWAHWADPQGGPALHPQGLPAIEDSVRPIWDAGLVELVGDGDEILPGLTARAAPGHTAGQLAIELRSDGAVGLFTADLFHQPMQIARPDWNSRFCEVPEQAIETRRRVLKRALADGTVLFPSHPGAPHAGRVAGTAAHMRFAPLSPEETRRLDGLMRENDV